MKKIDSTILLLFYPLLLIDSINGFFLLHNFPLPISQLYKIFLIVLLSFRILSFSPKLFLSLFFMLVLVFLETFLVLSYIGNVYDGPMSMIITFLKFFLFILSFIYFKMTLERSLISIDDLKKVCFVNLAVILVNLTIGLMGFGFPVYSDTDTGVSVGVKGFFFAGNELSAVYTLLVAAFLAFYTDKIKKKPYFYAVALSLFVFSALLATKSAIGGIAVIVIATIVFQKKYIDKTSFNLKNIFIVGVSITSITILSGFIFVRSAAFERMKFYYDQISNIYGFLMSGRDQFLTQKLFIFTSENSLFKFLFGVGKPFPVEMDAFDTFFKFGFLGLLMVYFIYFYIYRKVFAYYFKKEGTFNLSVINLALMLVFFQSYISGHVLYSGMAGPFYGMILAISFYIFKKEFPRVKNAET